MRVCVYTAHVCVFFYQRSLSWVMCCCFTFHHPALLSSVFIHNCCNSVMANTHNIPHSHHITVSQPYFVGGRRKKEKKGGKRKDEELRRMRFCRTLLFLLLLMLVTDVQTEPVSAVRNEVSRSHPQIILSSTVVVSHLARSASRCFVWGTPGLLLTQRVTAGSRISFEILPLVPSFYKNIVVICI